MGMSRTLYWTSWVVQLLAPLSLSVVIMVILLFAGGVLRYSSPALVLLFLEIYGVACVALACAVSSCFQNVRALHLPAQRRSNTRTRRFSGSWRRA